jgi:putative membrane protein
MNALSIPPINATFNGISTVLIGAGFVCIRNGRVDWHRRCMLTAAVTSALFLVGYVTYHALRHGHPTPFGGTGALRPIYFSMLISHIILAFSIAFLVPRTFYLALTGQFARHRQWARVTFPIWFYVSITGVLVYFFLYRWWPSPSL